MSNVSANARQPELKKRQISISYPFIWDGLENFDYPFDDNGIPRVYMGKKFGLQYNHVTTVQYGLWNLQQYSENKNEKYLHNVQKIVHWLVDNFKTWQNGTSAWIYDYDLDFYRLKAPWISGMAQGQGISLLLRYCRLISEERLLEITKEAFQVFLNPVARGGVVSHFPDGSLVFEEFPTNPPSLVLNGHVFALLGIYDYSVFWQDKTAKELFQAAVNGLKNNLNRYDTGFWNFYDLHPTRRLASLMYVKVHVQLLHILASLTEEPFFKDVADRWHKYLTNPYCRFRWMLGKVTEKVRRRF